MRILGIDEGGRPSEVPGVHTLAPTVEAEWEALDRPARLAFVSLADAADPATSSGAPFAMRKAFLDLGCEVLDVFPIRTRLEKVFLPKKLIFRATGRFFSTNREPIVLRRFGKKVGRQVAGSGVDFIFSPHSVPTTELRSDVPVVISHDQTFIERLDYFPFERRPPATPFIRQAIAQERRAFSRATLCAYPSRRSAEVLGTYYGVPKQKIAVVPWGANLPRTPGRAEVEHYIRSRSPQQLRLTFVGVDWQRKGGAVVAEVVRILSRRGLDVMLNVIGCQPPQEIAATLVVHPHLDKNREDDFRLYCSVLASSHLLFVPSRVEAFGHVFCEAAAFGVPAVTTDVGGLPTVVEDGVTGHCLSVDAPAEAFARTIEALFGDGGRYHKVALSARDRFERELNWTAFCKAIITGVRRVSRYGHVAPQA